MTNLEFGGVPVLTPSLSEKRLALLLWGPSGAGKTTLASTFPGKKLWINFDPYGTSSLGIRDDILLADFSGSDPRIAMSFRDPDPMQLSTTIRDAAIDSVIVDSVTAFSDMALNYGVSHARATGMKQHSAITIEDPSFGGYGRRKTWTQLMVMNILRVCMRANKHVCFISHEDSPEKDDKGTILFITMLLGSDLPDKIGLHVGEIWNLTDTGSERRLLVRAARQKKPIKSRMFDAGESPEFVWKYDERKKAPESHTVARWYEEWRAAGYAKIPLPK